MKPPGAVQCSAVQLIARSSVKLSKLNNGLYAMLGRKTRTARWRARVVVEVETDPPCRARGLRRPPVAVVAAAWLSDRARPASRRRINSHWRERRARRRETPRHGSAGCRFRGDLPFARRTSARIFSPAGVGEGPVGARLMAAIVRQASFVGPLSSGPKGWVEVTEVRSLQRCLRLQAGKPGAVRSRLGLPPSVIVAPAECQAICSALLLA